MMKTSSILAMMSLISLACKDTTAPEEPLSAWTQFSALNDDGVSAVVAIDSTVLIASANLGVYASHDHGTSWSRVTPVDRSSSISIVQSAGGGMDVLIGGGGVSVSSDTGRTWHQFAAGPNSSAIQRVLGVPVSVGLYAIFAATWDGELMFVSTDAGVHWENRKSGLTSPVQGMTYVPDDTGGAVVFAALDGGDVSRTTDLGATWTTIGSGLPGPAVYTILTTDPDMFVGTRYFGVYRSVDGGSNWSPTSSGMGNRLVTSLAFLAIGSSDTLIFAGTGDSGLFSSSDRGASWTSVNAGLGSTSISSLFIHTLGADSWLYAATTNRGVSRRKL